MSRCGLTSTTIMFPFDAAMRSISGGLKTRNSGTWRTGTTEVPT
jgi:hypothetical protein